MIKAIKIKLFVLFSISFLTLSLFFTNCGQKNNSQSADSSSVDSSDVGSNFSGQINSSIQLVSKSGGVWGYALDQANPGSTLKVIFYVDGPAGSGQYAGETQANVASAGPTAGHFFSFQLPPQFANGAHVLYAYGYDTKPEYLLSPNSFNYEAYTPKAQTIFDQQIKNFVQTSCASCHGTFWTYSSLFSGPLLNPMPGAGGSATNNLFIKKMSGLTSHGGGQFCAGGVNSGICTEIQKWWNAEFK